jgi:hypothetical protein
MDLSNLSQLGGLEEADNTPGLLGYVFWAPAYVGTAPAGTSAVIAADHAFQQGKGVLRIYITLDFNELKAEVVGERDGRRQKITFEGFHPGNEAASIDTFNLMKNTDGILPGPDADGTYLPVGAEGLPVELSPSYGSGKLSGGRRGTTLKGEGYAKAVQIYAGDVIEKPAA